MILHGKILKDSSKILLEFIQQFGKLAGYRINAQESVHFCALTMRQKKEK